MQTFTVFEPVLVRTTKYDRWTADFYDYPSDNTEEHWTVAGSLVSDSNILPYNEKTKHLHNHVGEFVKWEPKKGEPILVRDHNNDDSPWALRVFLEMRHNRFMCTSYPETDHNINASLWDCAKPYISPFEG